MTTIRTIAALLLIAVSAASAQQAVPPMTKDQEMAVLRTRLAVAEQQARQYREMAIAAQQPSRTADRDPELTIYDIDSYRIREWRSKLNPGTVCFMTMGAGRPALSCVRH